MALLDVFKKKKTEEKVKPKIREEVQKEIKLEKPAEFKTPKAEKEARIGEAYRVLKTPHVTEKAADLTEKNQYIFRIFPAVNKTEVKKAIEDTYGVDVVSVKIINVPEKRRRLGRMQGVKAGYKKAIVKIKEGQKIEVLSR